MRDNTHRQLIRDGKGRTIGYSQPTTHQDIIQDASGATLGYSRNGKVFGKNNELISLSDVPAILFEK